MSSGRQSRADRTKKYLRVANKVSLNESDLPDRDRKYQYPSSAFLPCVFFFKYLARKPTTIKNSKQEPKENPNGLKLNLPDTVIISDGDLPPMWLYTSQAGIVTRFDGFA